MRRKYKSRGKGWKEDVDYPYIRVKVQSSRKRIETHHAKLKELKKCNTKYGEIAKGP